MAHRPPDDPQDDRVSRRTPRPAPGGPRGSEPQGRPEPPRDAAETPEQIDFGTFVSRSVRSSANRLKGGTFRRPSEPSTGTQAGAGREAPVRRERPPRYWRDSFRERSGEEVSVRGPRTHFFFAGEEAAPGERPEETATTGDGGRGGAWWQTFISGGDGEGPNRQLIGLIALGVILLIALVVLISRLVGDDDGGEMVPTPTPTSVIEVVSTPGTPTDEQPTTPEEQTTPTPTIRRGGDNQRRPTPDGTPGAVKEGDLAAAPTPVPHGPVARSCDADACLVRIQTVGDIDRLYADTGSRPSFAGDDIAWLVSTPDQIAAFEQELRVELVRKGAETLQLYVVTIPRDRDDTIVPEFGTVVDAAGRYRLIEVAEVPARVRGLTDLGYAVHKLAPPAPSVSRLPQERIALSDVEIGSLMSEVSYDDVVSTISTLQGIGAADGASLGTRYYTLPGNQMAADYLFQELESYGLRVWYEDFLTPEGLLLVNVVGEVPGRDQSAIYGVMAHFDTISDAPGTAPGADDNATGLAASLEIARVLAGYELKHPVRIVFVNAEEVGILGASVWARMAQAEGVPVEGIFNVDSVGSDRQGRLLVLNSDAQSAWMQDLMIRLNDAYGLGNEILSRQNPAIVADDNMVREQGIEAVLVARELYGWSPYHHSSEDIIDHVSIDNVLGTTYLVLLSVAALVQ